MWTCPAWCFTIICQWFKTWILTSCYRPPWGQFQIREPSLRLFSLKVGPSGGPRGYEGITGITYSWSRSNVIFFYVVTGTIGIVSFYKFTKSDFELIFEGFSKNSMWLFSDSLNFVQLNLGGWESGSLIEIAGHPGSDLAWYVNGLLVPELFLRREFTYNFQVEGGDDPHSPTHYHPLIITDEPMGGYEQMTEEERKKTRVLAGVEFTRRGQPRPTAGMIQNPWGISILRAYPINDWELSPPTNFSFESSVLRVGFELIELIGFAPFEASKY